MSRESGRTPAVENRSGISPGTSAGGRDASMPVALVTGASSGIGLAAARELARNGYAVALSARRLARLEEACAGIRDAGGTALPFEADLTARGAPAALVAAVLSRFGRLDVLVNNAGWGHCAPLERTPEEAARRILELNLLAPFLLMHEAIPHLARTSGVIINISSGAGLLPSPYYAAYSASKAGLIALADCLRIEQRVARQSVRVVSICPGPVTTEFGKVAGGAPVHADSLGVRVQSAEEIARIIVRHARRARSGRRAGRTVCTSAAVRTGHVMNRMMPSILDLFVAGWARRIWPAVRASTDSE